MTADAMRKLLAVLTVGLFMGALGACEDQGPAEQAGEAVDEAVEGAGEAVEEAGEKAGEAVEEAGEAAEEATSN